MGGTYVPNPGSFRLDDDTEESSVVQCVRCGSECFLGDEINPRDARCPICNLVDYENPRIVSLLRDNRYEGGKKLYTDRKYYSKPESNGGK